MKLHFSRGDDKIHSIDVDVGLTDAVTLAVFGSMEVNLDARTEALHIANALRAEPSKPYLLGRGWLSVEQ
jgi:hypothetical protein